MNDGLFELEMKRFLSHLSVFSTIETIPHNTMDLQICECYCRPGSNMF